MFCTLHYNSPMQFKTISCAVLVALFSGLGISGCLPTRSSQLDEEKDSHFLAGKAKANALDYQGGLECFEKAIEANPRSALAHFEAGLLCEKYKQDYAAAIYHFERFLRYRPDSGYAGVVREHVLACKQELARTVSLTPITQSLQREFEHLSQENKILREEVEAWRAKAQLSNGDGARAVTQTPGSATPPSSLSTPTRTPAATNPASLRPGAVSPSGKMHTVKTGDTPMSIARRYGVKVEMLMAANPRLNARRLQVGQSVIVPH
jgi:LysM repeat protein